MVPNHYCQAFAFLVRKGEPGLPNLNPPFSDQRSQEEAAIICIFDDELGPSGSPFQRLGHKLKSLQDVRPTPEQLAIVSRNRPGVEVIRGAAGSGKTTTALLRLRALIGFFVNRRRRLQSSPPVRVLVITYNRTLKGYIFDLAQRQVSDSEEVIIEIETFSKWAKGIVGNVTILTDEERKGKLIALRGRIPLAYDFLFEEVEYILGRYLPENLQDYLTARRDGRGNSPRIEKPLRERILSEVIQPYQAWKEENGKSDWNDLAVILAKEKMCVPYDIIIVDETQDFSANQVRAINNHVFEVSSLTFILDTVQRIYARGFTWSEAGIVVRSENSRRLERNYRNSIEIARFALPLLTGIPIDEDGTMPDFSKCQEHGKKPLVIKGKFSEQTSFVIDFLKQSIDLKKESLAILHPLGGGWFRHVRDALEQAALPFVEITRKAEWPQGEENIALSTIHSAKGLEFDHVVIIGLNAEVLPHGDDDEDDGLIKLRRLLAMGIGRAKKSVILGYKEGEASQLISYLDPSTYQEVPL